MDIEGMLQRTMGQVDRFSVPATAILSILKYKGAYESSIYQVLGGHIHAPIVNNVINDLKVAQVPTAVLALIVTYLLDGTGSKTVDGIIEIVKKVAGTYAGVITLGTILYQMTHSNGGSLPLLAGDSQASSVAQYYS